MDIQSF